MAERLAARRDTRARRNAWEKDKNSIWFFSVSPCLRGKEVDAADYFGPHNVGSIFGLMLLPWAFPAAFGPLLFAYLRQATGGYNQALYLIAGMLTVAIVLPLLVSPPHGHKAAKELSIGGGAPLQAVPGADGKA